MISHKEVSEWYNKRYKITGNVTRRSPRAFDQIYELIPEGASAILDVGCGQGEFIESLVDSGFTQLAAVDISEEAIEHLKVKVPELDAQVAPGESLPFPDRSFDFITCLGVLEHFIDIEKGLAEMYRVCRDGGRAVIMVPNKNFLGWVLNKKEGKGTEQREIKETLYSVSEWRFLIENSGFEVTSVSVDRGFIYNNRDIRERGLNFYLKRILNSMMPLIPVKWTYQVIFSAARKGE